MNILEVHELTPGIFYEGNSQSDLYIYISLYLMKVLTSIGSTGLKAGFRHLLRRYLFMRLVTGNRRHEGNVIMWSIICGTLKTSLKLKRDR